MQHVKILSIGDVHICEHAPGRRQDGYKQRILDKLEECIGIAKERGVTHVLFLGDIFHLKSPNRVSHRLVQEIADVLARFEVPVAILVGNHDITDGSLDTLEKQPLGVLRLVPNVVLLETAPYSIDDDIVVYPIPGVTGVTIDDFAITAENKRDIMVVHQSIVPDISTELEFIEGLFDAKDVAAQTNIGLVLYGHQHRCDGVYKFPNKAGGNTVFSNLGSICRLTINDDDVHKVPAVLFLDILDDDNRTIKPEVIKLSSVVPPEEAYKLGEHAEEKAHNEDIEDTIRKLKESEVTAFSIEGVISDVEKRSDIDQEVKDAALKLLEEVR